MVTITASPDRLTSAGGAVDLTWSSQNATACTASGAWSGAKAVSGTERSSMITAASTFTLACTGAGGTTTSNVTVSMLADPPGGGGGGGAFDWTWLGLLALIVVLSVVTRTGRLAPTMVKTTVVAVAALFALQGCGGAQSRFDRSMERGVEFLEAGDLDKAAHRIP